MKLTKMISEARAIDYIKVDYTDFTSTSKDMINALANSKDVKNLKVDEESTDTFCTISGFSCKFTYGASNVYFEVTGNFPGSSKTIFRTKSSNARLLVKRITDFLSFIHNNQ